MPRKNLVKQNSFPYHITSRSNNKEWFKVPLDTVWEISKESFIYANERFPIKLHSFVLMKNHYHMLITTPNSDVDLFMQAFNKTFSEKLKRASGHINRMFGGPYKWSIIDNKTYLYNVFRYIFQNPVRANIATLCQSYPYSTLYYELHQLNFSIPIVNILEEESSSLCKWYNKKLNQRQCAGLKRGLKHTNFTVKKERDTKYLPTFELP